MRLQLKLPRSSGFTLFEIIVFIIVSSVIIAGIFSAYFISLSQANEPRNLLVAQEAASQRLELIIGQKRMQGFNNYQDPCVASPTNSECTFYTNAPYNCTIATTNTDIGTPVVGRIIQVSVTACGQATLSTFIGKY